jgi:uncharacterized phage protein (TIGR02216 family)
MRTGLGHLGLPPHGFWAMTPKEFDAALRGRLGLVDATDAFDRTRLQQLLARFPDLTHDSLR